MSREYKPNDRTYHKKSEIVVISTDGDERRRLKRRGFAKLRTSNLNSGYYKLLRSLQPGTYLIRSGPEGWEVTPTTPASRVPVRLFN